MNKTYEPIIGFEVHVELGTKSKMFCGCPADHFGKEPNSQTCPVCLGLPGALPVPQKKAVEWTILIGLALNCKIANLSKFDRKHYFYPDLPKGYQISQYDEPLCNGGFMDTNFGRVNITRVHLEEDTGKLKHEKIGGKNMSLVDFNRSGVPLVEIVTEPEIYSSDQAIEFAQKLQQVIRHLKVSDCDMEKGSMRLEANISLRNKKQVTSNKMPDYKVEIKNVNSFRFIKRAIDYDLDRQEKLLKAGTTPSQETRGFDENTGTTRSQRSKEAAADYRYFPEPDIPPMQFSDKEIELIRRELPELPEDLAKRWVEKFGMRRDYADILSIDDEKLNYTEELILEIQASDSILVNEVIGMVVNKTVDIKKKSPKQLIADLKKTKRQEVSGDSELEDWVTEAIKGMPQAVTDYKAGKMAAIGVLIGKVMGLSGGKANAGKVKEILEEKLK